MATKRQPDRALAEALADHPDLGQDIRTAHAWLQGHIKPLACRHFPPDEFPTVWEGGTYSGFRIDDLYTAELTADGLEGWRRIDRFVRGAYAWIQARYHTLFDALKPYVDMNWLADRIKDVALIGECRFDAPRNLNLPMVGAGVCTMEKQGADPYAYVLSARIPSFHTPTGRGIVLFPQPGATRRDIGLALRRQLDRMGYTPQPTSESLPRHRHLEHIHYLRLYALWKRWEGDRQAAGHPARLTRFYEAVLRGTTLLREQGAIPPEHAGTAVNPLEAWTDLGKINDVSTVRKALGKARRLCAPGEVGDITTFYGSFPGRNGAA